MQGIYTAAQRPQKPSEASTEVPVAQLKEEHVAADFANLLAPLIDPEKLDTLKGKRAGFQQAVRLKPSMG